MGRVIISKEQFGLTIERLCHQLVEDFDQFENTCIIGIQRRGAVLSQRIYDTLTHDFGIEGIEHGKLDVTFYRDDFRTKSHPLAAHPNEMDFLVEGKSVVLIDDVLYSGRTVRAALTALQHFGRAKEIKLLSFIDRRFNRSLPIKANYVGKQVDALDEAYVKVEWEQENGKDQVLLFNSNEREK